ncbi:MAG: thioredoxin family protein [Elusimicrobiota bacterium]|nr:thioredoxin family protein [Elusimicrobiota bacterium]
MTAAAALLAAALAVPAAAEAPFVALDFAAARKEAAASKKLLFVDFVSNHCAPCERMRRTTYRDGKVLARLAADAVAIEPNADRDPALAKSLRTTAYPTLLVFSPAGKELDRATGYHDAKALLAFLDGAATGKSQLQRLDKTVADAKDDLTRVRTRFERAQLLAGQGRDQDALAEFLWLFDEGMPAVPALRDWRHTALVMQLAALGRRLPAAAEALEARRAAAWATVDASTEGARAALTVAGIDRWSGAPDRTLRDYDALPSADPRRAVLGPRVTRQLLAAKRYEDCLSAHDTPDFAARFGREFGGAQDGRRDIGRSEAADWLAALAGARRDEEARRLIARVTALDPAPEAAAALRRGLTATGRADLMP